MSDQDLGVTGKDAQIVFSEGGTPKRVQDAVVTSSAEPVLTEIAQKHLGTSNVDIDVEHEGWKIEVEVSLKTAEVDEFIDTVLAKNRTRVPTVINVAETTRYRDGSSKSYTYPDCKLVGAPVTRRRGEVTTVRLSFRTGKSRIAS
jgi:hypothetical protein